MYFFAARYGLIEAQILLEIGISREICAVFSDAKAKTEVVDGVLGGIAALEPLYDA